MPKRQDILETATELFARDGYTQTSVKNVVEAVPTSIATFYRHFDSKLTLLRAIVEPRLERLWQLLADALARETDPSESLFVAVRTVFVAVHEDKTLSGLMYHRSAREAVKPQIDAMNARLDTLGTALLRQAMGDTPWLDDPGAAVAMVRLAIEGWFTWERAVENGVSRERLANSMETVLRAAIREFQGQHLARAAS